MCPTSAISNRFAVGERRGRVLEEVMQQLADGVITTSGGEAACASLMPCQLTSPAGSTEQRAARRSQCYFPAQAVARPRRTKRHAPSTCPVAKRQPARKRPPRPLLGRTA